MNEKEEKKIKALWQQIKEYIPADNWDGVIKTYNQLLKLDPETVVYCDFAGAYYNRGVAYAEKDDDDRAIADFTKTIEYKSNFADAYYNLGNAYHRKKSYDLAIANWTRAIEHKLDYDEAYYNRGNAYAEKGDYDRAIADYNQVIDINPNDAGAYYSRGVAYDNKDDDDLAIADYKKAIEHKSNFAEAYNNLGNAYAQKKNYGRAIANYKKAIKYKSNFAEAYNNLGNAYAEKGDYDHAIEDYKKAIECKSESVFAGVYYNCGLAYAKKGDYEHAVEDLAKSYERGIKDKIITYISYRIKEINPENLSDLFDAFMFVWFAVRKIMEKLFLNPNSKHFPVVHYCPLITLESMIKGGRFRFYNAAHMDDPKEGEAFFDMISGEDIKKYFYGDSGNRNKYPSFCYIGSFVANENKDEHIFWQIYGKDKGIGAAGCNLIFNKERFSREPKEELSGMTVGEIPLGNDITTTVSDTKLPVLYSVLYEENDDIKELLDKLKDALEKLQEKIKEYSKHKKKLKSLACELIDSVRYLFKSPHYSSEQEVRVIEFMAPVDDIKTDDSGESPKFYVEPYEKFIFDEVTLGGRVKDFPAWHFWLDKEPHKVKVKESKISYR